MVSALPASIVLTVIGGVGVVGGIEPKRTLLIFKPLMGQNEDWLWKTSHTSVRSGWRTRQPSTMSGAESVMSVGEEDFGTTFVGRVPVKEE